MDSPLPLYDGVTGQLIPADVDARVEHVRDALLDAARQRVDTLGEAAVEGELPRLCCAHPHAPHWLLGHCMSLQQPVAYLIFLADEGGKFVMLVGTWSSHHLYLLVLGV